MATQELPPLRRKTSECDVPANRFEGDLFQRSKLADQLTGFLYRLPDGAVIAIDSQWGEGKTWFGRRWNASLQDEGFHTAYIDCFQQDHLDDPFTMIAGELLTLATATKPQVQTTKIVAVLFFLGTAQSLAKTEVGGVDATAGEEQRNRVIVAAGCQYFAGAVVVFPSDAALFARR